jgi:hypothetical protein
VGCPATRTGADLLWRGRPLADPQRRPQAPVDVLRLMRSTQLDLAVQLSLQLEPKPEGAAPRKVEAQASVSMWIASLRVAGRKLLSL